MAPRKRISKIASRIFPPDASKVQSSSFTGKLRSVGSQTEDPLIQPKKPAPEGAPSQPKRKKTIVKVPWSLFAPQFRMVSQVMSETRYLPIPAVPSTSIGPAFVVGENEKMCQTEGPGPLNAEEAKVMMPRSGFVGKMGALKSIVDRRQADSICWDRQRLITLLNKINADPPPRWHQATQMWVEVDQLEDRIEKYEAKMELEADR
ncbi:hypothetical protein KR009_008636 [Drosophila setifemur]|nr:hypothetical protein KR009_008636 [Drosophila setifemur]